MFLFLHAPIKTINYIISNDEECEHKQTSAKHQM